MLPRPVREAEERANRIHSELYGNTGMPPAPAQEPDQEPVVIAREPAAPAPPVPTPAPAPAVDTWETKYRVLEGKYNAEVPRMARDLRELQATIQELRDQLAAPTPAAPVPSVEGMTPEQVVEQFGEDFAKAVGSVAERIAQRNSEALRNEFKPKLDEVEQTSRTGARAAFMTQLERAAPNWAAIDATDGFTAFLNEIDALSGLPRRHFFNEADRQNDAARIARFYTTFEALSAPAPAPAAPAGPAPIEYALAPPNGSRASGEPPPSRRMWTSADIRQFYVDVRKGRFTPQDAKRIESDIFAAQRENRLAA